MHYFHNRRYYQIH